jgi:hypothetical protein
MREIHPLVPLASEHALGVAVVSYDGTLFFGVVADPDSVPDLDVMLSAMRDAAAELLALARVSGAKPANARKPANGDARSTATRSRRAAKEARR